MIGALRVNIIQTSCLGQILHTRLRLECSSLNFNLYMKSLVESPLCSCGAPETSSHFFLSCTHYSDLRQRYFSCLGLPLTVNILLNGKPDENVIVTNAIFRRVQLYILATKCFTSNVRVPSDDHWILIRIMLGGVLHGV